MQAATFALPADIAPLFGEINDADGHENLPINFWLEEFGTEVSGFITAVRSASEAFSAEKTIDDAEITSHNVWHLKLEQAPGAFDLKRRIDVLDFVGTRRQLMYPGSLGVFAMVLYSKSDDPSVFRSITNDRRAYARRLITSYNEWCVRQYRSFDRLRPVGILAEATPEAMLATARDLIDRGIRAFWFATDEPPAKLSPAHPAFDPLWQLLAEQRCPVLSHIGACENFMKTMAWRDAPAFEWWLEGSETRLDPFSLSTMHLGTQTFLTAMIMGAVFERHPDLCFGSAELGGAWVGPLGELLDLWNDNVPNPRMHKKAQLSMKPSDYIRRNVRIVCQDFEPVGSYISRYDMADVFCYGSDYPHREGGTDPIGNLTRSLSGQSAGVLRKFYVENARPLLPD